jgi:hypothetical protein
VILILVSPSGFTRLNTTTDYEMTHVLEVFDFFSASLPLGVLLPRGEGDMRHSRV